MNFQHTDNKGLLWTLGSVIAFGLTGFIDKIGTNSIHNPLWYSFITLGGALSISLFYVLFVRKLKVGLVFQTNQRSWWTLPALGIISSGIYILLRFYGLQNSTATFVSLSQVLTSVLTVMFAAVTFKEKLPRVMNLLLPLILMATYFFSTGTLQFSTMKSGDILIVIAAIILALGNLVGKHAAQSFEAGIVTLSRVFFGLLLVGLSILSLKPVSPMLNILLIFPLISGVIIGINFMCYYEAVKKVGVSFPTAALMISPLLTKLLALFFLHETLNWLQTLCFFIILIAGYLVVSRTNSPQRTLSKNKD